MRRFLLSPFLVFLFLFFSWTASAQKSYHFESNWELKAPVNEVFNVIKNSKQWPDWWKSITKVEEKESGGNDSLGNVRNYTIKSPIGYKLRFDLLLTDIILDSLIGGDASGDLIGRGSWLFTEKNNICYITCLWDVKTTKGWMNTFRFILAPILKWNHKLVMKKGAKGLAKKMDSELVDY